MTSLEEIVAGSRRLAPNTIRTYLARLASWLGFATRDTRRWTPQMVERWRDTLAADDLSPNTVNNHLAALKFASRRYAELGYGADFAAPVETLRSEAQTSPKALTVAQVRRLLATCGPDDPPDRRDRAMILVGIHCGFRRSELCAIEFGHFDSAGAITVLAKGRRPHRVRYGPECGEALGRWKNWLRNQGIVDGPVFRGLHHAIDRGDGREGWVASDTALTPDAFAKMLQRRADAANLDKLTPHQLRHTCASLLLAAGVEPWRVKLVLGHKSDHMIAQYTHDVAPTAAAADLPVLDPLED